MRSERPKPIHLLCGRPMMSYVIDALDAVGVTSAVVVTGVAGDRISKRMFEDPATMQLSFVEQPRDRGSADAALIGLSGFDEFLDDGDLLVVPADLPLIDVTVLAQLVSTHRAEGAACTVLTVEADEDDPWVIDRNRSGRPVGLRRADPLDEGPRERLVGLYCISRGLLAPAVRRIPALGVDRRQDLADILAVLADSGHGVATALVEWTPALEPINSRRDLAEAEATLRARTNRYWLERGVTMVDPSRTYIDATVRFGVDVTLFPGTILQGETVVGDGCEIGPDTRLDRCQIGRNCLIEKTMARLAEIGDECRVGPFAVLEPGSVLSARTVTGPFYAARADD